MGIRALVCVVYGSSKRRATGQVVEEGEEEKEKAQNGSLSGCDLL
jgi:6-phosphogluconolactonase/glucosamine-6-phosphate isomerase/deaminase